VNVTAGGDVVAGDKTTTTTIEKGFAGDQQKQQFQSEIDQLREALQAMKTEIEASASLQQDKKDEVINGILEQIKALKEVKEKTADVPTGKPAPAEIATKVEGALDRAGGIVEKLQGLATKTGDVAETVGKFAVKYGPLILSARHLFGLP
jgi:DNA repair exonuclease SbcCD ATPase subunit